MPRRNAKRVPHHRLSRDQRFTAALASLTSRLDRLRAAINREHPVQDCLPLPALELPAGPDALDQLCTDIADNLFADNGDRAQRWIDARGQCPHVSDTKVNEIFEMVYQWYGLLSAARHHLDDQPLKDLGLSEEIFDRWIPAPTHSNDDENGSREQTAGRAEGDEADQ